MATEALVAADCQMQHTGHPFQNGGSVWSPSEDHAHRNTDAFTSKNEEVHGLSKSIFTEKDIREIVDIPMQNNKSSRRNKEIMDIMDRSSDTLSISNSSSNNDTNNNNNNNNNHSNNNNDDNNHRLSQGSRTSTGSSSSIELVSPAGPKSSLDIQHRVATPESVSPLLSNATEGHQLTRSQMVAKEIVVTEKSYVNDLQEVIVGYLYHMYKNGMTDTDVETIFCNLEDIYDFNRGLLEELEMCKNDPVRAAQCFVDKGQGFNSLYVPYCTNYPEASAFLSEVMKNKEASEFFLERQRSIGHALPLEAYLLKPVQRILKYHLLLEDIAKHYKNNEYDENVIQAAVLVMTDVADYINEMKRLQEDALKAQEVLSRISDLPVNNVLSTGKLVLENSFRIHGARGERYLFLFAKKLLICKKMEEDQYKFLDTVHCSNMMLVESLPKDPLLSFQVIRFDNQKIFFTIQAKNPDIKKEWTQQIKRLILENHPALIPSTARQAILGRKEINRSKYDSMQFEALDDSVLGNKINLRRQRSMCGKENQGSQLAGIKRESVLKSDDGDSLPRKATANSKQKEHPEKKGKHSYNSGTSDKNRPWRFKKQKPQKLNIEKIFESMTSARHFYSPSSPSSPVKLMKSRSLESLRDAIPPEPSEEPSSPPPPEAEKSKEEVNQQLCKLGLLHDIISMDAQNEDLEKSHENATDDQKPGGDNFSEYPVNESVMRRAQDYETKHLRQVSQSMVFENFSPKYEHSNTFPRTRPTSLPPGDDQYSPKRSFTFDETKRMFGVADAQISRGSTDLRKFGLSDVDIRRRLDSEASSISVFERKTSIGRASGTSGNGPSDENLSLRESDEEEVTSEGFVKLEKRLSMLSDDESCNTSIKNTIRRVSQAFSTHSTETSISSSGRNSESPSDIATEISTALGSASSTSKSRRRKSNTGSFGSIDGISEEPDVLTETPLPGSAETDVEDDTLIPQTQEDISTVINDEKDIFSSAPTSSFQTTDDLYRTLDESCKALDEIQKSLDSFQDVKSQASEENIQSEISGSEASYQKTSNAVSITLAPRHAKSVYERAREYAAMMQENVDSKREKVRVNRPKLRRCQTFDTDGYDFDSPDSAKSPVRIRLERAATEDLVDPQKKVFSYDCQDFLNEPEIVSTYHGHVIVKPVADRIIEYQKVLSTGKYNTLPSRPKATVDEMLESLDSIPNTNSEIYNSQRRKYNHLRTRSVTLGEVQRNESDLFLPTDTINRRPCLTRSSSSFDQVIVRSETVSPSSDEDEFFNQYSREAASPLSKKITVFRPHIHRDSLLVDKSKGNATHTQSNTGIGDHPRRGSKEDETAESRNIVKFTTNVRMCGKHDDKEDIKQEDNKDEVDDTQKRTSRAGNVQFSINFELADKNKKARNVSTTFTAQVNSGNGNRKAHVHGLSANDLNSSDRPLPLTPPSSRRKVTNFSSVVPPQASRKARDVSGEETAENDIKVSEQKLDASSIGLNPNRVPNTESHSTQTTKAIALLEPCMTEKNRSPSLCNIEKCLVKRRVQDYIRGLDDPRGSTESIEEDERKNFRSAVQRRLERSNIRKIKTRSLVEDYSTAYDDEAFGSEDDLQNLKGIQRSSSCEQLQKGTVRQLIGVFNT